MLAAEAADEPDDPAAVGSHLDELAVTRGVEPLAPHAASLGHQVAVQKLVAEAAAVRPPPAVGVQLGDALGVRWAGHPVLHGDRVWCGGHRASTSGAAQGRSRRITTRRSGSRPRAVSASTMVRTP